MKRTLTITIIGLCALMITSQANAQFAFGIKGGANIANISNMTSLSSFEDSESYTGFHAGLFLGIKLPIVMVQAEALYSVQGVSVLEAGASDFIDLENTYINVPLVAKVSLIPMINIQGGIQYSFLTKSLLDGEETVDLAGSPVDLKDQLNSGDASALIGIGFDISKLIIDLRYNFGLSNLDENLNSNDQLKSGVFQASVGFRLK